MSNYDGMTYFALDGSYGDATEMLVLDTSKWTLDDWRYMEEASDMDRQERAQEIHNRYEENSNG